MKESAPLQPFRLSVELVERVWGRQSLKPWYDAELTAPIGEAWMTGEACVVETGPHAGKRLSQMALEHRASLLGKKHHEFPLLIKILFPQDKLSVQVHPNDAQAAVLGGGARAKTECWYVLEAEQDASIALGLKPGTTEAMVQDALGNVAFEDLLQQQPIAAGDMIYVEAGTVHALNPGAVILETQQTSDTTYRLYDYGRPRELHLETGAEVIRMHTASGKVAPRGVRDGVELIRVEHFVVERYELSGDAVDMPVNGLPQSVVCLSGEGEVRTQTATVDLRAGQAVVIPADCGQYSVSGRATVVRCGLP